MKDVFTGMESYIFSFAVVSLWHIGKAALDAICFKDREGAKRSLFLWLVSASSIGFALCASLFFNYFGYTNHCPAPHFRGRGCRYRDALGTSEVGKA